MTTLLITGSRNWTDHLAIQRVIAAAAANAGVDHIIHGGARGADEAADVHANFLGIAATEYPADWTTGRGAGYERNIRMLDTQPDFVCGFWLNRSRGTAHTLANAIHRGIPTIAYDEQGRLTALPIAALISAKHPDIWRAACSS
jgi:hypothetical protein